MERVIDHFNMHISPRTVLAAIDRMATKSGYSVYGEMDGLRIHLHYAQIRIKHDEKQFEIRAKNSMPKFWIAGPLVFLTAGIMTMHWLWMIAFTAAAYFSYKLLRKAAARAAVAEIDAFHDLLVETVRHNV